MEPKVEGATEDVTTIIIKKESFIIGISILYYHYFFPEVIEIPIIIHHKFPSFHG